MATGIAAQHILNCGSLDVTYPPKVKKMCEAGFPRGPGLTEWGHIKGRFVTQYGLYNVVNQSPLTIAVSYQEGQEPSTCSVHKDDGTEDPKDSWRTSGLRAMLEAQRGWF